MMLVTIRLLLKEKQCVLLQNPGVDKVVNEEIKELREEYNLELNMLKDNVSHLFIRVDELIEKRLHTHFSHSTSEMHNLTYLWEREVDMDIQNFLRNISK